tara:strand:+ start:398 stop:601 length:204 start_codon:yes stop_codon:yes gene_type:complete
LREEISLAFPGVMASPVSGDRGSFEVFVNEFQIFSKLDLDRFPNEGEIINLINLYIENEGNVIAGEI